MNPPTVTILSSQHQEDTFINNLHPKVHREKFQINKQTNNKKNQNEAYLFMIIRKIKMKHTYS